MKINYLGSRDNKLERDYEGKFTSFKRRVKSFFRKCVLASIVFAVGYGIYIAGGIFQPRAIAVETIVEVDKPAPVLDRIIKCESQSQQKGKSGQVLMNANTNGTVDIGVGQINTVWFAKATELGYDLTKEEDNRAMALWIYKNKGTSPWSSSSNCWSK